MASRMDKYKDNNEDVVPTRSDKNKVLYKQIYNAYDEFENLIIPSNAREITAEDLKKEITSRREYREMKEYDGVLYKHNDKEEVTDEVKNNKKEEVYDINLLLNKAIDDNKKNMATNNNIPNNDYLKKLNLDSRKTNIEQVKEVYNDIAEESRNDDEALLETANLSLEILSDLKGDNTATFVSAPIRDEEMPTSEMDFYSNNYKFSKKDFESKESNDDDIDSDKPSSKLFFKILIVVFVIVLLVIGLIYCFKLFNKV